MKYIYLQPFGLIPDWVLGKLSQDLPTKFNLEVKILSPLPIPDQAYDTRRSQYEAKTILTELDKIIPLDAEKIVGVVPVDLYSKDLRFVFGEAELGGKRAVISIYHLVDLDDSLFYSRVLKETVHELGHTFGFSHDPDPKCVMSFSNSIEEVDEKDPNFCQPHFQTMSDPAAFEVDDLNIASYLEGMDFPTEKEKIIEHAINISAPREVIDEFSKLPTNWKFNSANDVLETIEKLDRYDFPD
ncbi:MAG: archaemetzincin family Zn-dependent metalloprotease [Patescibacteria group bacterium]|nr:archaemetzincin family Zn-dependent metalloprotease [Patescibacteria group bacterium]